MGQVNTKISPKENISVFVNLPKEAIFSIWTSYNLLGEGWGLSIHELVAIFHGSEFVANNYIFTKDQISDLFNAFDTDCNGLVDALELFVSIALISGKSNINIFYSNM